MSGRVTVDDGGRGQLSYLGVGCVWAWIYCAYGTTSLGLDGTGSNLFFVLAAVSVVLFLLVGGVAMARRPQWGNRWMGIVAPVLMACGTVFTAFGEGSPAPVPLAVAAALVIGPGFSWMCILWGRAFTRLNEEQVEFLILGSSVVTTLCAFIVPSLTGFVATVVVAFLPVISGVLLICAEGGKSASGALVRTVVPPRAVEKGQGRSFHHILGCVLVVLAAAYFVLGFLDVGLAFRDTFVSGATGSFDIATFVGSSIGIVLALATMRFAVRIDMATLFRWLTPVTMLGICLAVQPAAWAAEGSAAITSAADVCIQAIAYLYFVTLAKKGELDIALGIGLGQGFIQFGVLAGNVVASAAASALGSSAILAAPAGFALILLLAFATALLPTSESLRALRSFDERSSSPEDGIDRAVIRAMREYGLSAREGEVLGYLARGRSQPYIQEALYLSKSTISTHVKHIYRKMDVHSKQELLNALEEVGAS